MYKSWGLHDIETKKRGPLLPLDFLEGGLGHHCGRSGPLEGSTGLLSPDSIKPRIYDIKQDLIDSRVSLA